MSNWTATLTVTLAVLLMNSPSARAQDCSAIIRHGLRNIEITHTEDVRTAALYFNHCQKNFSSLNESQLAQVEVEIFGQGRGGGGYSAEKRKEELVQWCTTNRQSALSHQTEARNVQTFYAGAVAAWSKCNELASRNFHISPEISDDQKRVVFDLFYTGGGQGPRLNGFSSEAFDCSADVPNESGALVPFSKDRPPVVSAQAINVECVRKPAENRTFNDEDYLVIPGGSIAIKTAQDSLVLSFPEVWEPPLPRQVATVLTNEMSARRAEITQLSTTSEEHRHQIAAVRDSVPNQIFLVDCASTGFKHDYEVATLECPGEKVAVSLLARRDVHDNTPEHSLKCCRLRVGRGD